MPYHFPETPSTQVFLKKLAQSDTDLPHLEYAIADLQTAGIGRQGRSWISEPGNLFLSVYLRDFALPLTWIPHWIGVSVVHALASLHVPTDSLRLKWPNDLIVDETRKAGGILCEKIGSGVVAGIGVNLISAPEVSDRHTASICTLAPAIDFFQFHLKLCESLLHELKSEPGLASLKNEYQRYSLLSPGCAIEWMDLQTKAVGRGKFLRYGEFGELIVLENDLERALYSEEVKLSL